MQSQSDEWPEVYRGAPAMALMVRDRLESEGLQAFVPDQNLRIIEPFLTGGNAFELRVLVAGAHVEHAKRLLAADAREMQLAGPDGDELDPRTREVQRVGERIVNAAALGYMAPVALWNAPRYFASSKGLETPPRGRKLVVAATALAACEVIALTALLIYEALREF